VKKAKIVYVDMDDVIADFYGAASCDISGKVVEERMFEKNFFLTLNPIPGAKAALFTIEKMGFDLWILSQPLAEIPESYIEKAQWVQLHFPHLYKKLILTQDKGLNFGHFLIDDNKKKWQEKFEQNGGKFIHFNYGGYNLANPQDRQFFDPEAEWKKVINVLKQENPYLD
jgi:5'-nucleotidase